MAENSTSNIGFEKQICFRRSIRSWLKKVTDLKKTMTNTPPKTSSLSLQMQDGARLRLPLTDRKLAR